MTVSIGAAAFQAEARSCEIAEPISEQLIRAADSAMYRAKKAGEIEPSSTFLKHSVVFSDLGPSGQVACIRATAMVDKPGHFHQSGHDMWRTVLGFSDLTGLRSRVAFND